MLESRVGSITGGNGAIYATRREAYVVVDPIMGHDLSFPFNMVKRGWRAVYVPTARAQEKMVPTIEGEFARKRRMMSHGWPIVVRGGMLSPRGYDPLYAVMIVSHRLLRYLSPFLHVIALVTSAAARRPRLDLHCRTRPPARAPARRAGGAGCPVAAAAGGALLRPHHGIARRRAVGLDAERHGRGLGAGGGDAMSSRVLDVVLAGLGSIASAPLVALLALVIRLETPGHPIYRQTRVGRDGESFEIFKLRTMVRGAEFTGAGLAIQEGDDRITRVGAFLRRFSLDELPNLWNVLRGEMAIVGPRPTVPVQVEQYTARQRRRLEVKPGITGWAQINGRASLPWSERIELDVWYVEHRSAALDLRILARTAGMVLSGHGLYKGERGGWHPPVDGG